MQDRADAAHPPHPPATPLRYDPRFEQPDDDEAQTTESLIETLRGIAQTTLHDSGHAIRGVHAKSHGLLRGELQVLDGLPAVLAQGLFAKAATYPVVLRLSTTPGDILDDSVSTPRGLAIKVVGVEGDRLPGSAGEVTQDFVLVNGPVFLKPDPKAFLASLKLLAATTDRAEAAKKALSAGLRGVERLIERAGGQSGTLKAMGGHPMTHILGETFYSQVPLLYGPYMAKVSVAPVSPELTELTDAPLDREGDPNALRDAVTEFFSVHGAEWEVRVQLCTDLDAMPIEDASIEWPEKLSPYVAVARIVAPAQPAWTEARAAAVDDGMSFSPWHGLAAHRPLGAIMRVRRAVYEASAQFRSTHNRRDVREPRTLDDFPE